MVDKLYQLDNHDAAHLVVSVFMIDCEVKAKKYFDVFKRRKGFMALVKAKSAMAYRELID